MSYTDGYDPIDENPGENGKPHTCRFQVHRVFVYSALSLSYAICLFIRICPSIVEKDMAKDYGISDLSKMGIFTSLYFYSYGAVQPFIGLLVDVVEPGYIVGVSQLLAAIGTLICGRGNSFQVGCVGRVLVGFGCGPTYVAINRCLVNWFSPRWYPLMLGIVHAIGNVGYLCAQGPLAVLSNHIGWRGCFYGLAVIGGVVGILDLLVVRGNPLVFGYKPVNPLMKRNTNEMPLKEKCQVLGKNFVTVCKSWPLWMCVAYAILTNGPFYNINGNWGSQWLQDVLGFTKEKSGYIMMSITISGIFGSLIIPPIADLVKSRKLVLVVTSLGSVGFLGFGFLKQGVAAWVICLLFSIESIFGSTCSITYSMGVEYFDPKLAGAAVGLMNTFLFFISAVYQAISSAIIAKYGTAENDLVYTSKGYFWGLWVFSASSYFLSVIVGIFMKKDKRHTPAPEDLTQSLASTE